MKAKVEDYLGEINALKGDEDAMEELIMKVFYTPVQ